ncbi:hypothetical protein I5693_33265 [Burkholderia cenocepacia]|uniref:Uncharacterized protein n=1 Tax=Burkholderia cenocepacia TaxID=95486 RepID=A0A427PKP7_9BURK|nr:hypothetical protein [Burkholderia cenocepacia]MBJ9672435.1 hypothetical protein [Burkholderia cenocepacia]MBJ9733922.1 hypothetical protein [Burkholderia cenocepacia]MBR8311303.1 hypothetical protein [Burkholderia cenocepacia]MBR8400222.1 hypothetical protein [Burkholderia cenocepacia]MCA7968133.1 hypothetical protein [Burkholderia cenocepacia]
MKTACDLLLDAPDDQVTRCRLAWKAVAAGDWQDAAHFLRNAANEAGATSWAADARAQAEACAAKIGTAAPATQP